MERLIKSSEVFNGSEVINKGKVSELFKQLNIMIREGRHIKGSFSVAVSNNAILNTAEFLFASGEANKDGWRLHVDSSRDSIMVYTIEKLKL